MNVNDMLNGPSKEDPQSRRRPRSDSYSRPPTLPFLRTSDSGYTGGPPSATSQESSAGYFPPPRPPSYSPGSQYPPSLEQRQSYSAHTPSYGQQTYIGTPVSSHVAGSSASSNVPGYFGQRHGSQSGTPISSHLDNVHSYTSPGSARAEAPSRIVKTPQQYLPAETSMGSRAHSVRPSSQGRHDSVTSVGYMNSPGVPQSSTSVTPTSSNWAQPSVNAVPSPGNFTSPRPPPHPGYSSRHDSRSRSRSVSVSPKTVSGTLPAQPLALDQNYSTRRESESHLNSTLNPSNVGNYSYSQAHQESYGTARHGSNDLTSSVYTEGSMRESQAHTKYEDGRQSRVEEQFSHPAEPQERQDFGQQPSPNLKVTPSDPSIMNGQSKTETLQKTAGLKRPLDSSADVHTGPSLDGRQTKKRRTKEIPIWAQRAKNLKPLPKYQGVKPRPNGNVSSQNRSKLPQEASGPLGPFEETFLGSIFPYEELTKNICDFLFLLVVENDTLQTGKLGETPKADGQLEIEAKLGKIVDRRTRDRLHLPVKSETVLDDSLVDIAFESTMSEQQHQTFNRNLNEALQSSYGPPTPSTRNKPVKPRIPMKYEHKKELDSFHDLPESELTILPPSVRASVNKQPHRKPRLRVTRDHKTGKIIAKIIKVRLADMHVFSPATSFDWRISVSYEMNWDGDVDAFLKTSEEARHTDLSSRQKDRMSYKHLFCQIDLTQVKASSESDPKSWTHELEVELESSAVRRQGKLVKERQDNEYESLVRGFVDNVRYLVRAVPPQ